MKLIINEIEDRQLRENFKRVENEINKKQAFLKGDWKFFEITFTAAVTNFKYPHKFSFVPKDIVQTGLTGAGSLTWNYSSFDRTNLDITTTGACVVRAFIGRYEE